MDPDNPPEGMIPDSNIDPFEIVIRDRSLNAGATYYAKVEFLNGSWSIYWLGCF